jgi:hypothetical protein
MEQKDFGFCRVARHKVSLHGAVDFLVLSSIAWQDREQQSMKWQSYSV